MKFLLLMFLVLSLTPALAVESLDIPTSFTEDRPVDGSWLEDGSFAEGSGSVGKKKRDPASESESQDQESSHVNEMTGTFSP